MQFSKMRDPCTHQVNMGLTNIVLHQLRLPPPGSSERHNNCCLYMRQKKREITEKISLLLVDQSTQYKNFYRNMLAGHPVRIFYAVQVVNFLSSKLSFVNTYCFSNSLSKLVCIFMVRVSSKFCNKTKAKEGCLSRRTEDSTLEGQLPDEKTSSFLKELLMCQ